MIGGFHLLVHEFTKGSLDARSVMWQRIPEDLGLALAKFFLNQTAASIALLLVAISILHFMLEYHHYHKYATACMRNIRSILTDRLHMYASHTGMVESSFQFQSLTDKEVEDIAFRVKTMPHDWTYTRDQLQHLQDHNHSLIRKIGSLETDLHGMHILHRIYEVFRMVFLKNVDHVDHLLGQEDSEAKGEEHLYLTKLLRNEVTLIMKCLDYIKRIERHYHRFVMGFYIPQTQ